MGLIAGEGAENAGRCLLYRVWTARWRILSLLRCACPTNRLPVATARQQQPVSWTGIPTLAVVAVQQLLSTLTIARSGPPS